MPQTPPQGRSPSVRADDLRQHNLAVVVQHVASEGTVSRAQLARLTHLTKATVSTHVQELLRLGLLVELGVQQEGRVGRPHSVLALNGERHCGVGLEVNVDYIAVCVLDLLNRTRVQRVDATDNRGVEPAMVLARAAHLVETAIAAASHEGLEPGGIAVALPGAVELETGRLLIAPNLGWSDVAVVDELAARLERFDLPVHADNEAHLAALAELWLGEGAESGDYVFVSSEIGIGAGIVVGGALFRGSRGFAGELGHVVVDPDGPPCPCGGRGCLEQFAGQDAILREAGLPSATATSLGAAGPPFGELLERLARGDEQALAATRNAATALGDALADVVNLIDPDTIILGGTYATLAPWLREPLQAVLARQVIASRWRPLEVRESGLGPEAAVRGAASLVVRRVLSDPGAVARHGAPSPSLLRRG